MVDVDHNYYDPAADLAEEPIVTPEDNKRQYDAFYIMLCMLCYSSFFRKIFGKCLLEPF